MNPVLRDILALSDGTLSVLTGLTHTDDLQRVVEAWVEYVELNPPPAGATWVEAWSEFRQQPYTTGQVVYRHHAIGEELTILKIKGATLILSDGKPAPVETVTPVLLHQPYQIEQRVVFKRGDRWAVGKIKHTEFHAQFGRRYLVADQEEVLLSYHQLNPYRGK